MAEATEGIRLQKVLAAAGVASRRASETLIAEGRVQVNGRTVKEMGFRVDPEKDQIRVDGSRIPTARRHKYLILNKPKGVVSTMNDPEGRPTLTDYLPGRKKERLFHVGRLDVETEGLIILTNDGEFAHRMTHPSYQVHKTYLAEILGLIDQRAIRRLEKGITLEDGPVRPDKVKIVSSTESKTLLQITIHEGRNRIVRRMMDAVGYPVNRLSRTAIGPVKLRRLAKGECRELTSEELGALFDLVKM